MENDSKQSLAMAGRAISSALIDLLIQRNIISREDALQLLVTAQAQCLNEGEAGAARVVGALSSKYRPQR